jgi:hypothetical protein
VPPVSTPKDAERVLITVFPCINGDAHKTHSLSVDAPRLRSILVTLNAIVVGEGADHDVLR